MRDTESSDIDDGVDAAEVAETVAKQQNSHTLDIRSTLRSLWQSVVHNEDCAGGPLDARGRAGYFLVLYTFAPGAITGYLHRSIALPSTIEQFVFGMYAALALLMVGALFLIAFSITTATFSRFTPTVRHD